MSPTSWRVVSIATVVGCSLLVERAARAKPGGEAQACGNCHYKTQGPKLAVTFSEKQLEPGQTITISIAVEAVAVEARRTGFMIKADQGRFVLTDTASTRLHDPTTALHSRPRDLVDRRAEFNVRWTAPRMVGVTNFEVSSMTGHSNGKPEEYHHSGARASIAHGCEGKVYFRDMDGDGFGDPKNPALSCVPLEGFLLNDGDCNDADPKINPNAIDICNARDDNCDGRADEGLEPGLYYQCVNGYAPPNARAVFGCNNMPGYTSQPGTACGGAPSSADAGARGGTSGPAPQAAADAGRPREDDEERGEPDDDDRRSRRYQGGCRVDTSGLTAAPTSLLLGLIGLALVLGRRVRRR